MRSFDDSPLSVTELTMRVKRTLEEGYAEVSVVGEVSNVTAARSGHIYLTLKDEGAALSAVIWRSTASRLRFDLEEGMEVVAGGRIVVYAPRGQYQLDVRAIEPRGAGALRAALEKLVAKLRAEGLFEPERKRSIPFLPATIGVVTSPTGAAIRDILQVLRRRLQRVTVILYPVRVQGAGAAEEIASGVRRLGQRGDVDVLIVGRGGGSAEDLWAFNEEVVARAIAESPVPVISAVGHEIDISVSDMVADLRAPTPSAAAELAVPSEADVRDRLGGLGERLSQAMGSSLRIRAERMKALGGAYGLLRFPDRLREVSQQLDELGRGAARGMEGSLERATVLLGRLAGRAHALSPVAVLARGYSVTTVAGEAAPLTDASRVEAGGRIRTRLAKGSLLSRVDEIEEGGTAHGGEE